MSSHLPPLIVILGPTASGKTEISLQLAKKINGFIISADSRQIYRGLDIGTAKVTPRTEVNLTVPSGKFSGNTIKACIVDGIYHFMIDQVCPDEEFSLGEYQSEVFRILGQYHLQEIAGKIPFVVGGTGLYITSIVDHLKLPKVAPNPALRTSIEKDIAENGLNFVYQRLLRLDPEAENLVDSNNPRRVIRALEVCLLTGKPFTKQQRKGTPLFDVLQIGVHRDREQLYQRIDHRVDMMKQEGLETEVRQLVKKYNKNLPAFSGIGYRQMLAYIQGEETLEKAFEHIKRDTKRFVRRQMTWWRRDDRIQWIRELAEAEGKIDTFLKSHQ